MLVITRNLGDSLRIGDRIVITVACVKSESVKLGIDAPREIGIAGKDTDQRSAMAG